MVVHGEKRRRRRRRGSASDVHTCEVRRFLSTQTRGFLSERAVALRRINGCLLKQESSRDEAGCRERINCRFLTRKRGRFVETSAGANRSPLFSRRPEIALFTRSPREVVPITMPPRKIYARLAYIIVLYAAACRGHAQHRQVHNATACTRAARGEQEEKRERGRMSPRFGRCFFTSEYLRVHRGLNNEPDGGGSSGALRSPLLWAGRV